MKERGLDLPKVITDNNKTTELCGHERDGARCMRRRGHTDRHESLYVLGQEVVRWE